MTFLTYDKILMEELQRLQSGLRLGENQENDYWRMKESLPAFVAFSAELARSVFSI